MFHLYKAQKPLNEEVTEYESQFTEICREDSGEP